MITVPANKRIALKDILFLTDFSESSATAATFAVRIARVYGSVVHTLHVLMPSGYTLLNPEVAAALLADEEDTAHAEMQKVEARLCGLPNDTRIQRGAAVWPVLSAICKEQEIELIVMGTHGSTGVQKLLLGSTAEEVFRRSHAPVLTIGPAVHRGTDNDGRFHCVLFATDFNAVSIAAAAYAISLAQENQARLFLLHVLPKPKSGNQKLSIAEAMYRLRELVPVEADLWLRPEVAVQHGDAACEILAAASGCRADLIVLGVQGIDRFAAAVTHVDRAIAYQVVANASCPVLTVRG